MSEAAPAARSLDLTRSFGRVLTQSWLLWTLTAVFALRGLFFAILAPDRPDARNVLLAGQLLLNDPRHLYTSAARALALTGTLPVPGQGFLYPPPAAYLAVPFSLLPLGLGVAVWTVADFVAAMTGLLILYRLVRPRGAARPLFWLLAAYFPPLFAEVDAGQIGGFVLLLAVLSVRLARTRPLIAGALAGVAATIKVYPAAMALGAGARWRYWVGLGLTAPALLAASFAPLGLQGPAYYLDRVLLPATLHSKYQDCAINSVRTLYLRTVGGETYYLPGAHGLLAVTWPFHQPGLAAALSWATVGGIVAAALWAIRASHWHPVYGFTLAFALGALVPSEVNPYQFLPLLPLILVVAVSAAARGRLLVLAGLGIALLGFVRPPCESIFPNVWTLAGLAAYAICVCQNDLFRPPRTRGHLEIEGDFAHGDQRPGQLHVDRARHLEGSQRPG